MIKWVKMFGQAISKKNLTCSPPNRQTAELAALIDFQDFL